MKIKYQQGSALAVFAVVITITLLFALGWIFWQNFIYKQPESRADTSLVTKKPEQKAPLDATYQTYEGDTFTFQYPKAGWKSNDTTDSLGKTVSTISTLDYSNPHDYVPEKGAEIVVHTTAINLAGEFKKPTTEDAHGISDIQELKVDRRVAYFHRMAYEGIHYVVHFRSDKLDYRITLTAAGDDATRAQKDVFNQVWKTFDIK